MGLQDRDYYKEHHNKLKNKESNLNSKEITKQEITWSMLFKALITLGGIFVIIKTLLEMNYLA
jgi:hypothetical protein